MFRIKERHDRADEEACSIPRWEMSLEGIFERHDATPMALQRRTRMGSHTSNSEKQRFMVRQVRSRREALHGRHARFSEKPGLGLSFECLLWKQEEAPLALSEGRPYFLSADLMTSNNRSMGALSVEVSHQLKIDDFHLANLG